MGDLPDRRAARRRRSATNPGFGSSPPGFWLPVNQSVAAPTSGNTGAIDFVAGKRAMRTVYNSVSIGQDQPQVILTTQGAYEQYEDSLVDQIRYTSTDMADAGFQNLMFKACPITYDADAKGPPVQTNHNMDTQPALPACGGRSDTWFKNTPFVRPNNRDARTAQILCYGQFVTMKRSRRVVCSSCPSDRGHRSRQDGRRRTVLPHRRHRVRPGRHLGLLGQRCGPPQWPGCLVGIAWVLL
jgi:hypothetical protein